MRGIKQNLLGQKFGFLTVIAGNPSQAQRTKWVCQCDCGQLCTKSGNDLRRPNWVHSCGCQAALVRTIRRHTHGGVDRRLDYLHKSQRPQSC